MPSPAPSPSPSSDPVPVTRVTYGASSFDDAVRRVRAAEDAGRGLCLLFLNGSPERRQQALGRLSEQSGAVHQFRLPALLSDQRMQTQNALRKAFDHAAEEGAFLFFDRVDAVFDHVHADASDVEGEAEPTTAEYFFDRVRAYTASSVVLGIQKAASVKRTNPLGPRIVVGFD